MNILNSEQIENIRISGKYLAEAILKVKDAAHPGTSTFFLDEIAFRSLTDNGCRPSFKDYYVQGAGKFPSSLCVSINNEIVHGIPDKSHILKGGDLVSLDLGAEYRGVCTDMAITFGVGKISSTEEKLLETTKQSLALGIAQATCGNHINDIGIAVQKYVEANGFNVLRDYVGHGIGTKPHLPPQIPNFDAGHPGTEIVEAMALAIEPMVTIGSYKTKVEKNGWTVTTVDGSKSAHFEHTIVIVDGRPEVVTDYER